MPASDQQQPPSILEHPQALDCTLYRSDENDPDAEEQDLGDARILLAGKFEAPLDWDAHQREEYFGEEDPDAFHVARIECLAKPGSKAYFSVESGDYVAVQTPEGDVVMYYVYDQTDDEQAVQYVLIRDDEEL